MGRGAAVQTMMRSSPEIMTDANLAAANDHGAKAPEETGAGAQRCPPGDGPGAISGPAHLQSQKLAAVGVLAAGVMHEINNPISAIIAYAQFLLRGELNQRQRADVEHIAAEALRASRILHNLLTFARPMRAEKTPIEVNHAVQNAIELRSRQLAEDHIAVCTELSPDLPPVEADGTQLEQVFVNLINNARDAMLVQNDGRRLTITTATYDQRVCVIFDDSGPGIANEDLDRIFDPFFTTKDRDRGTGLGLAICYGILREHGGGISVHNLPQHGARFIVELPAAGGITDDR